MNTVGILNLLITTLSPIIIIGWYIYRKDHYKPEPTWALFFSAFAGFLGGWAAYMISNVGWSMTGIYDMVAPSVTATAIVEVMQSLAIADFTMLLILTGTIIFNRFSTNKLTGLSIPCS